MRQNSQVFPSEDMNRLMTSETWKVCPNITQPHIEVFNVLARLTKTLNNIQNHLQPSCAFNNAASMWNATTIASHVSTLV